MISKSEDKLTRLKKAYVAQIQAKEAEINAIRTKLLYLEQMESDSTDLDLHPVDLPAAAPIDFNDTKLTKAILITMERIAKSEGVRAAQVRKYLLDNGFKPSGKHFGMSVVLTLKRLSVGNQRIRTYVQDEHRYYQANK
jgi:hypothetical protein